MIRSGKKLKALAGILYKDNNILISEAIGLLRAGNQVSTIQIILPIWLKYLLKQIM
jgi:hypothetical protein